jgi:predicted O-methyltransferase YrrM
MKMHHIRPRFVLSMPDEFAQEIRFFMPMTWTGGLSALESIILLKLMRVTRPSRIFEFGTFEGETTRFLLANLPPADGRSERIYTLDLAETENVVFEGGDDALAKRVLSSQRKYSLFPNAHLVKQLLQDSMHLDPQPYRGMFQFVFIDANHKLEYVRKDTENAFEMVGGSPHCVVWHDYGNPDFPELTQYLDDLAKDRELYHVEDTMLVFQLSGKPIGPG